LAERGLLYTLGQFYRLWRSGDLEVCPLHIDVGAVARTVGVLTDVELVSRQDHATAYHFAGEVLVVYDAEFPWKLMSVNEWVWWGLMVDAAADVADPREP
jgi:hypothetical protein